MSDQAAPGPRLQVWIRTRRRVERQLVSSSCERRAVECIVLLLCRAEFEQACLVLQPLAPRLPLRPLRPCSWRRGTLANGDLIVAIENGFSSHGSDVHKILRVSAKHQKPISLRLVHDNFKGFPWIERSSDKATAWIPLLLKHMVRCSVCFGRSACDLTLKKSVLLSHQESDKHVASSREPWRAVLHHWEAAVRPVHGHHVDASSDAPRPLGLRLQRRCDE